MPRRRTRHTAQMESWKATVNVLFVCGLVLIFLLVWLILEHPLILAAITAAIVLGGGGVGFWLIQRRRHLEQLQAYEAQQLEAAYQQQQWDAYHHQVRISQQRELLAAQQRLLEQRRQLSFSQDLGNLLALTPRDFELAVGGLLGKLGYQQVRHTGKAGDLAADLHAVSPQGERVIVQCKRFAPGNSVGSGDMQKFIGMRVHHGAQRALFVTTSTFKPQAAALARQHGIELIDGQRLVALFAQVNQRP